LLSAHAGAVVAIPAVNARVARNVRNKIECAFMSDPPPLRAATAHRWQKKQRAAERLERRGVETW